MTADVRVGLSQAFVCLFTYDISKTNAAGITKLDIEMIHIESWKPIYFRICRSRSGGTKSRYQSADKAVLPLAA